MDVAFCPERIAEPTAMTELYSLPQLVSSRTERGKQRAAALFSRLTDEIIVLEPEEAELAKLFTNTWRYIKFAAANQFYMMANDRGLDFERIRSAVTHNYPRAADLPGAGFSAGPCLLKDTMQLAAFSDNKFALGHAAMLVNEGLPLCVVSQLEKRFDLRTMSVGILGMSFKAGSDDTRSSLSYKLRRVLRFKAKEVLATDPYAPKEVDDLHEHGWFGPGEYGPVEKLTAETYLRVDVEAGSIEITACDTAAGEIVIAPREPVLVTGPTTGTARLTLASGKRSATRVRSN
jgi:UDP-N-acetyl-D-mannosaminuronic acid dehydrogenase